MIAPKWLSLEVYWETLAHAIQSGVLKCLETMTSFEIPICLAVMRTWRTYRTGSIL